MDTLSPTATPDTTIPFGPRLRVRLFSLGLSHNTIHSHTADPFRALPNSSLHVQLPSSEKYRMHRRHILPKEDDQRWSLPRDSAQRSHYLQKPIMAFPQYHSNYIHPAGHVYPAWMPLGNYPSPVQMWGSPYYSGWQPTESWYWQPYSGMHADA